MKTLFLTLFTVLVISPAIAQTPKGYKHFSLQKGLIEIDLPDDFSVRKDSAYQVFDSQVWDYKFSKPNDNNSTISIQLKTNTDTSATLELIKGFYNTSASRSKTLKLKGNDIVDINGTQCLVANSVKIKDNAETDYERVIGALAKGRDVFISISFKGKAKEEYSIIGETITKSLKLKL